MSEDDKYTYPGSGGVLRNRQGIRDKAKLDNRPEFAAALAERWGDLTIIHPFRDGNTRSQSLFFSQMTRRAGHAIAWSRVDVDQLPRNRSRDGRLRPVDPPCSTRR